MFRHDNRVTKNLKTPTGSGIWEQRGVKISALLISYFLAIADEVL